MLVFFVDQGLHIVSLWLVWRWLLGESDLHADALQPAPTWLGSYVTFFLIAAGYAFNGSGGTAIVRKLLERYPQSLPSAPDDESGKYAMGRTIGALERFTIYTLVLLDQWSALGFVIAAKSIACFKELERQVFADYYLIGTLGSMLVAVATGLLVRWFLL